MNEKSNIIIYGIQYPNPGTVQWEPEECPDVPLSDEEFKTLLQGYSPDWDCRYVPFHFEDWFYITRSGFWLKKFKYQKKENGFYHLSQHQTSDKERGRNLLFEILCHGYFRPSLFETIRRTGILNQIK